MNRCKQVTVLGSRAMAGLGLRWAVSAVPAVRAFASQSEGEALFRRAVAALQLPPSEATKHVKTPSNEEKLQLYALFKQAELGDCSVSGGKRPGLFDVVGRAKFDAWASLAGLSKDEARSRYAATVTALFGGSLPNLTSPAPNGSSASTVATAAGGAGIGGSSATSSSTSVFQPRNLRDVAFPRGGLASSTAASKGEGWMSEGLQEVLLKSGAGNDGVATVTLSRPKKGNAFGIRAWEELGECWRRLSQSGGSRCVILQSCEESPHFSTGMDLSVFAELQSILSEPPTKDSDAVLCEGRKREAISKLITFLQDTISGAENLHIPVIAVVKGNCIGGAIDLICAADLRYCTKDAQFCIKETDLAIVADIGTLNRLPKLIGHQRALELTYTGRTFTGVEAEAMGLVVKAFDSVDEMNAHVTKVAKEIASKSPITIRGVKKTVLFTRDHTVQESLEQVKLWNSAFLLSDDLLEAATSLMQKRKPDFKGN